MRSIDEVVERRKQFRKFQANGYERYVGSGEMPDYFRGWDDGVLMLIEWLLEERD